MRRSASAVSRAALRAVGGGVQCEASSASLVAGRHDFYSLPPPGVTTTTPLITPRSFVGGGGKKSWRDIIVGLRSRASSFSSASTTSDDHQQRLFEHYAVGLRGILASVDNLDDARLAGKLRALRRNAPVKLEYEFWGAQFLAMAFGHEVGHPQWGQGGGRGLPSIL